MEKWDIAVRSYHWVMVALFITSWASGDLDFPDVHYISGFLFLTLLLFRVFWGIWGSDKARLSSLNLSKEATLKEVKNLFNRHGANDGEKTGHTALGSYSKIALLSLVFLTISTGLFSADDDLILIGPLNDYVSYEVGEISAELHETFFNILRIVVGIHIAAIFFYLFYKRDNLITAMSPFKRFEKAASPDKGRFLILRIFLTLLLSLIIALSIFQPASLFII